ncbi:hypothetical protein C8Q79DRAFT_126866 [Trametes meyenii]|nr:hypothetical protein C8Q79DRAFT_126866 [Trametes meyenii]
MGTFQAPLFFWLCNTEDTRVRHWCLGSLVLLGSLRHRQMCMRTRQPLSPYMADSDHRPVPCVHSYCVVSGNIIPALHSSFNVYSCCTSTDGVRHLISKYSYSIKPGYDVLYGKGQVKDLPLSRLVGI